MSSQMPPTTTITANKGLERAIVSQGDGINGSGNHNNNHYLNHTVVTAASTTKPQKQGELQQQQQQQRRREQLLLNNSNNSNGEGYNDNQIDLDDKVNSRIQVANGSSSGVGSLPSLSHPTPTFTASLNGANNNTNRKPIDNGQQQHQQRQKKNNNLFLIKAKNQQQRQVRFKSLFGSTTVISESDENYPNIIKQQQQQQQQHNDGQELIDFSNLNSTSSSTDAATTTTSTHCDNKRQDSNSNIDINIHRHQQQLAKTTKATTLLDHSDSDIYNDQSTGAAEVTGGNFFDSFDNDNNYNDNDNDHNHYTLGNRFNLDGRLSIDNNLNIASDHYSSASPSHPRFKAVKQQQQQHTLFDRLLAKFKFFTTGLTSKISKSSSLPASLANSESNQISYSNLIEGDNQQDNQQQQQQQQTVVGSGRKYRLLSSSSSAASKVTSSNQSKRHNYIYSEKLFRGPYRYSRLGIVMALIRRLFSFLIQRSTLALFGAFLIHITLGTVYTLSNVNSYLTSYMRSHGTPNATYGSSMWMSSSYAVGQGFSMVLGGYLEKRFSARLACILGCLLHSLSIISTFWSINHGQLLILLTYGLLPGFGCGLAYMTPMSNGFGWFPHRKGLVAGVILAGFGIGTFVFNMAQTAFVNPENLSPLPDSGGYFTQKSILDRVPLLFIFLGTIYASMQFIGCCLLFKPPSSSALSDCLKGDQLHDERPLLSSGNSISSPDEINCTTTTAATNNANQRQQQSLSHLPFKKAIKTREFLVLFAVFGVTNQGVLFVNSMLKEYAQLFINDDMYLAWTGSMASIANSLGRLFWGLAIDRFSFTKCFTATTTIFGTLMFLMPFEFILSSKLLYLLCTLGVFGSFSGWMSTYPVHLSRVFGVKNSGMIYGLIFVSQSIGGIMTAFGAHYLIDHFTRFVPFFVVTFLEVLGLSLYHLFYFK